MEGINVGLDVVGGDGLDVSEAGFEDGVVVGGEKEFGEPGALEEEDVPRLEELRERGPGSRAVRQRMRTVQLDLKERETSRTEFRQQMRSRVLPAYLTFSRLVNGILSYS